MDKKVSLFAFLFISYLKSFINFHFLSVITDKIVFSTLIISYKCDILILTTKGG